MNRVGWGSGELARGESGGPCWLVWFFSQAISWVLLFMKITPSCSPGSLSNFLSYFFSNFHALIFAFFFSGSCLELLYCSEKAMAPHSSTLAWKILWMEEPGRLQSMGSLRVRND